MIRVYAGSILSIDDVENLSFVYLNNCICGTSYQPLSNPKTILNRYKSQVPNCKQVLAPCGGAQILQSDFISFEKNLHFCLKQIFETFNVIRIEMDTSMPSGFAGSRVPDVFADIAKEHAHEITQFTLGEPLTEEMTPVFKAIGELKIFRLLVKGDKRRLSGDKIQDVIKHSVEILRPFHIAVFTIYWSCCATKLSRFDLVEFNLLGPRPVVAVDFIILLPSTVQDLIEKWKKSPLFVRRIMVTMELQGPVKQLMLMENETETAKKKAKKLIKKLDDPEKERFGGTSIPIAIIESSCRFLMIDAEPNGTLHIYTTEKKTSQPGTSY